MAKAKRFTRLNLDRHHQLLREMPDRAQQRSAAVDQRMAMLQASEALSLRMESDRAREAVHSLPAGLQRAAALERLGDLSRQIHRLARQKGFHKGNEWRAGRSDRPLAT